ncbi:TIGR01244 family sulfur transferase [Rhodalgimonas zhirmunskyi]|uniref:Bifunctional protein tyrosine phosphatase family protein/NAD(P)/FAD-dependent oxidoreductase n=1 Tax=Rhodalgimonas zhirmunskyi TaxID=2964767 RepID=A0AAJ1X5B9_9RHOB|nr:TIGR01244 family sulfur transferase [Rhodoalgimonas zhirmunskyi]MDQ2094386.1 bifunctional protein tyrosine phosphatase family protein/NAD(P)/FAD-dependent oxidoreductase [Rhodoalgimonas zhirmunskyi]
MEIRKISDEIAVSPQIAPSDLKAIHAAGYRSIICNRPDGEAADQPTWQEIESAAKAEGLETRFIPISGGMVGDEDTAAFRTALMELPGPVFAYCRTGTRSTTLWSLAVAGQKDLPEILEATSKAGYDMAGVARRIVNGGKTPTDTGDAKFDVVIVGAGSAGIAVAASLKSRKADLNIAILDPADVHYYQPGWTMVGGGIFEPQTTAKEMGSLIPKGVTWIKSAVAAFEPKDNAVILDGCRVVKYDRLVVCAGLKLDWDKVEGLRETLGRNGVTSNYRYDLAPYTWEMVKSLKEGKAIFTQPPMPIKCPGAPQKALYLSADHWKREGLLPNIDVSFMNAGGVLFGVKEYVPALEQAMQGYNVDVNFGQNLVAVDGAAKKAWFEDGEGNRTEREFDMLHVAPPQCPPDFIKVSPIVDAAGWVDVDQASLRHKEYENIWALGDVANTPNSKTAAAARAQAPVVAENIVDDIAGRSPTAIYNGYGSCPLTVERGKIVLAEFGYGGVVMPTFPKWLVDGTKPTRLAWILKEQILPPVYWKAMLRGREWLAKPEKVSASK